MGRRRSARTRSLPPNLYERNGYFSWRDPRNGKEHGLGRNRREALTQAIEANHKIEGATERRSLVERLDAGPESSVSAYCDLYEAAAVARHAAGKLSQHSLYTVKQRTRDVRARWGDRRLDAVSTRDVADFLNQWVSQGKLRMAQAVRAHLKDLFSAAIASGWVQANPVSVTKVEAADIRRARLTLEEFLAIHAVAVRDHSPWLAQAMELALVTGQRREDVVNLGPRNVWDGRLWVVQGKTKTKISIPLELRLKAVGWSVGEVIARCRDAVPSGHFIHHSRPSGRAKPGDRVQGQSLALGFADARDQAGLAWSKGVTPPSFHEMRSLAARLYTGQGTDAQSLLGHKSPQMTARYRDSRGAEWVEVQA